MKSSSTSINRGLTSILALAGAVVFSIAGVAYAQSDTGSSSGQGSSGGQSGHTGQGSQKGPTGGPAPYDILEEPVDTGYVDQEKRERRAKDPRSPSPEGHVPNFPVDKEGKPIKDPQYEQGGPIGPN
ncbi:MAG TPA: hypothetical protein VJM47_04340 [Nitrosospira sp.]|nr:hypothetical protein [Nitrosospira sp.]